MGADRFVYWTTDRKPTWAEIRMVTEDFLGEMATTIAEPGDGKLNVLFVTLVGKHSHPLRRIDGTSPALSEYLRQPQEPGWEGRYLEVWEHNDSVNIETRRQDEVTMRIADGLAGVFARFWDGKLEAG